MARWAPSWVTPSLVLGQTASHNLLFRTVMRHPTFNHSVVTTVIHTHISNITVSRYFAHIHDGLNTVYAQLLVHARSSSSKHTHTHTQCTLHTRTHIPGILLTYTLFATPYMVGFFWNEPPCNISPTLFFDVFVDIFFIIEITLTFFTGVTYQVCVVCVCVCVCVWHCMHICMCVCVCVCVCVTFYLPLCLYACMYVCIVQTQTNTYVKLCLIFDHVYMHTCMHACMHA
jgi:hypothetical protein